MARSDGDDIERIPEVIALGRRRCLPIIVDDAAHQRRPATGPHDDERIGFDERTPM